MMKHTIPIVLLCGVLIGSVTSRGDDATSPSNDAADQSNARLPSETPLGVEQLAKHARDAVVEVTVTGRRGTQVALGTGFVVSPNGLIATNLHVIAEARPITVKTTDGRKYAVETVHASDRKLDLALLKIEAKGLQILPLGDSDAAEDGQAVVALGNPYGLTNSVVSGVISGRREIEGRRMLQLAIPIETGNSGGPLLDMHGHVLGLLTMKSQYTANLGFAMPVTALKKLIEKPNPVPMDRWLTIGALDPEEWSPRLGAVWRQRSGRISASGRGSGFGGRSFCLSYTELPEVPYELAVTVRLDDERGAAGLLFHSDDGDRHYGFYPSGARMRLTRFDGPDILTWTILTTKFSPHYRPGDWNTLKVRVESDRFLCYVNDELVVESADRGLVAGKVGLAKFRDTEAEFKNFRIAKEIAPDTLDPEVVARIEKLIGEVDVEGPPKRDTVTSLLPEGRASVSVLRNRAKRLEQQAVQLRKLAREVHQQATIAELAKSLSGEEGKVDLLQAALLVARLDNDELDVAPYQAEVARMARGLSDSFPDGANEAQKLAALNKYLFDERGFHGSRTDYYNKSNSYLNEVIDDREGLPIALSVLYIELARRVGLKVVGVGLPGHFLTRHEPTEGESQLVDPFERGKLLSREDAAEILHSHLGVALTDDHLKASTSREIITRMLTNLMDLARQEEDVEGMLRYVEGMAAVNPEVGQTRWFRAILRFQTGRRDGASDDVDWLLEHQPAGVEIHRVEELRSILNMPRE